MSDLIVEVKIRNSTGEGAGQVRKSLADLSVNVAELSENFKKLTTLNFEGMLSELRRIAETVKQIGNSLGNSKVDRDMQKALADIRKYQQSRLQMERDLTRHIDNEAEKQYRAQVKRFEQGAKEFQKILNQSKQPQNSSDFQSELFSTIFGATTLSGLAVNGILKIAGAIKQLITGFIDLGVESLKISADFERTQNAMKVFTGSTRLANIELRRPFGKLAKTLKVCHLKDAEDGAVRLESVRVRR